MEKALLYENKQKNLVGGFKSTSYMTLYSVPTLSHKVRVVYEQFCKENDDSYPQAIVHGPGADRAQVS